MTPNCTKVTARRGFCVVAQKNGQRYFRGNVGYSGGTSGGASAPRHHRLKATPTITLIQQKRDT